MRQEGRKLSPMSVGGCRADPLLSTAIFNRFYLLIYTNYTGLIRLNTKIICYGVL